MVQAGEDAEDLQVALHAQPVRIAQEAGDVGDGQAGCKGARVVTTQPGVHASLGPAEEGIAQQADRIVGDRSDHHVLEIEHRRAIRHRHQVARHVIAVRRHARLRQRVVHQSPLRQLQALGIAAVEFDAEVAAQIPVLEQPGVALQQRLAEHHGVFGQRDRLQDQQLGDRAVDVRVGIRSVDHLRHRRAAEVFQQQEAGVDIAVEHARHAHAAGLQQVARA